MKKEKQDVNIGRIGAPTNLRAGGVMQSANRKLDARRGRKASRQSLRSGNWD